MGILRLLVCLVSIAIVGSVQNGICIDNVCQNDGVCWNSSTNDSMVHYTCQECFTGEHCELKNNIIALSLTSAMLTDIRNSPNGGANAKLVYVFITTLLFAISMANNILGLLLFVTPRGSDMETRRPFLQGFNRLYLISYCIYSLISMLELELRVILMLFEIQSVRYKFYLCNIAPVFSTMMVHLSLWISAFYSIEQILVVIKNRKAIGVGRRTFVVNGVLFIVVAATHLHEIFGRQALPDPLLSGHYICTFDYGRHLNVIDDVMSIIHLVIPCLMHCVCIGFVSICLIRTRADTDNPASTPITDRRPARTRTKAIGNRPILLNDIIPPLLIIVCALPHFLFAHLIYHCIESHRHGYLRLHIALNLLVFIPQTTTFFIYVLPNNDYRQEWMENTRVGRLFKRLWSCRREGIGCARKCFDTPATIRAVILRLRTRDGKNETF